MPFTNQYEEVPNQSPATLESPLLSRISNWLVRRRIAISLIGFTTLAAINLGIVGTRPLDPVNWYDAPTLGFCLMILSGLSIRSWAAGTLHKSTTVTQVGPYSLVRNPLYVGSFLMMFGFCGLLRDMPTALFVAGPMVAIYWFTTLREERNLATWFANDWSDYQGMVPRFIPKLRSAQMLGGWSLTQWWKNREYNAVVATLAGVVAIHFVHSFRM